MRRAERLLALTEALRSKPIVRGSELASELEVSLRTLYRDIAALIGIGVPIRGEAGVGYSLEQGYYLPPLNLTTEEAEMIDFGLRLLQSVSDGSVDDRVKSARIKIRAVVPRDARSAMDRSFFSVANPADRRPLRHDLLELKRAAANRRVLEIEYVTNGGRRSMRTVRPLSPSFIGSWFMIGWCEELEGFRRVRIDRIERSRRWVAYLRRNMVGSRPVFLSGRRTSRASNDCPPAQCALGVSARRRINYEPTTHSESPLP